MVFLVKSELLTDQKRIDTSWQLLIQPLISVLGIKSNWKENPDF